MTGKAFDLLALRFGISIIAPDVGIIDIECHALFEF